LDDEMKKQTPIKFKIGDKIKIIKGDPPFYRKGDIGKIKLLILDPLYEVDFRKLNEKWFEDGRWCVMAQEMVKVERK
jgi:hypothetical protein